MKMKLILYLIPIQLIAILDTYIQQYLRSWINIHYDSRPILIYQIFVYILFGIFISIILSNWQNVPNRQKKITVILGISNICAICFIFLYSFQIPTLALLLFGVYLYLGISGLKKN